MIDNNGRELEVKLENFNFSEVEDETIDLLTSNGFGVRTSKNLEFIGFNVLEDITYTVRGNTTNDFLNLSDSDDIRYIELDKNGITINFE